MKVAVLIHAHREPNLVKRLVACLQHPQIDVYINVDARVDISNFSDIIADVTFMKNRVEVVWGRFSQVQQILNSYEEILNTNIKYSHILFISGQDYPVKSMDYIVNQLSTNIEKSYLDFHLLKDSSWDRMIRQRYEYWYFLPESDIRNKRFVKKILNRLKFKRKYPLTPYYGSCWMCLTLDAVKYSLKYTSENPDFVKFNQHTGCPDELYFQSILVNSPLKDSLINNIHRYIDWSDEGKSPKVLTMSDLEKIKNSDSWFVRKVDLETDSSFLNSLDNLRDESCNPLSV
ncbi:beta-1,6-N-acetylglucosaminyltransferase [Dysgonomonas sp. 520]|uniref:beta-1,6-N-acetylglucosaminyltransferase n=1 Tax=Dysgonomonas sp. 520 TaxID=2302931 RepID=UPI0013D3FFD5|nr:beta-1,6-N-acetylglucosaminyltransferase [Dysgonomonas sp. 520]NDW09230.1 hypothetical protein [Dysgonomonas sp. 520]